MFGSNNISRYSSKVLFLLNWGYSQNGKFEFMIFIDSRSTQWQADFEGLMLALRMWVQAKANVENTTIRHLTRIGFTDSKAFEGT